MTADPDVRALLQVSPDEYTAERTRAVKQAKDSGDRTRAGYLQSLKRPPLPLWAVLAAATTDERAVRDAVTATAELVSVQASGADRQALATASQQRRDALGAVVDGAVRALARWSATAESRRPEIVALVDQLTRHGDLVEVWVDGSLRDVPEESLGFSAFAALPVPDRPSDRVETASRARTDKPQPAAAVPVDRDVHAAHVRRAESDLSDATKALGAAERALRIAEQAFERAMVDLERARERHATAEQRHGESTARLADVSGDTRA